MNCVCWCVHESVYLSGLCDELEYRAHRVLCGLKVPYW